MSKPFILLLVFMCQQAHSLSSDSLQQYDYARLSEKLKTAKDKGENWKPYATAWKTKAENERNWKELSAMYRTVMYLSDKTSLPAYSDSLVSAALKTYDNAVIGAAYLTKGIIYYDLKQHEKALDNYIIANKHLVKTKDKYTLFKARYALAHSKYYLGYYHEAIALFKECIEYFRDENDRAYLNSLHSLGLCYTMIQQYQESSRLNSAGLLAASQLQDRSIDAYFIHSEGVNRFFMEDYEKAIQYLEKSIPTLVEKSDLANASVGWFYIGKSLLALNKNNEALPYFEKVDGVFTREGYIRPDLKEAYDILLRQYTRKAHPEKHAYFMENSLKAEKALAQEYKHLAGKMQKEWIMPQHQATHSKNEKLRMAIILVSSLSVLVTLGLWIRQLRLQRQYKIKFRELMKSGAASSPVRTKRVEKLDINEDTVQMVVKRLERFESEKKYLSKDIELQSLATYLHTNSKYASRIIYVHRGKGVVDYIRDLKLDHIIELLKTQRKYRRYTYDALAQEVGFGSAQNFTRAFKARYDLAPSYFISQLEKELS